MLFVHQHAGRFRIPKARHLSGVYIIGDDFDEARGPTGFHLPSVRRAIRDSVAFAVVAGKATAELYASMTEVAVGGGRVMIVETRPTQEIPGVALIQKIAPSRMLIWSTVHGGRA